MTNCLNSSFEKNVYDLSGISFWYLNRTSASDACSCSNNSWHCLCYCNRQSTGIWLIHFRHQSCSISLLVCHFDLINGPWVAFLSSWIAGKELISSLIASNHFFVNSSLIAASKMANGPRTNGMDQSCHLDPNFAYSGPYLSFYFLTVDFHSNHSAQECSFSGYLEFQNLQIWVSVMFVYY